MYQTAIREGLKGNVFGAILSLQTIEDYLQKAQDKYKSSKSYADKYEKLTVAKGEAEAVERVYQAIHNGRPTNDLIAIKYLEALQKIADGKATKIFLPFEASGVLGSVAGIGDLLKEKVIPESTEK